MIKREREVEPRIAFANLVIEMHMGIPRSPRQVARKYEVSLRTAQRWLSDIDCALFPLERGPRPMNLRWRAR